MHGIATDKKSSSSAAELLVMCMEPREAFGKNYLQLRQKVEKHRSLKDDGDLL